MASTRASISKVSKRPKINIIPPKQLFVDLTQDDTKTPSPKLPISSPSAPNAPSKTPSTKDTSSSSIDYIPKSPTSSTSLSPNGYLNPPTSPPPRVSPPHPTQENASMDITLTLSPITPLDVQFDTPSPSPPIIEHPIPWNLLEAHDDDEDELDEPKAKKHKALLNKGRMANNNDVHMTFLDKKKELPIKKAYGKEVQKINNVKANDESPIWFNTDKKKKPCFVKKSPAMNLIDEPTDEEFSDSVDFNEDFVYLFDDQANDDVEPNPETLTEATKDFPNLDDFADATAEDLYDSDMYSVRSVSDGDEEDNFINDDSSDYYYSDENTDDDI
ncbi:hypothetical protein Tco_0320503 [Tanacetum coccineum]